ncbi:hypothetical protein CPB83DRAFT_771425, partial [Crepidotus variabilis]
VVLWDILSCLPDELRLLTQYKFNLPTFCYCVARYGGPPASIEKRRSQEADNCHDWASVLSVFFAFIHIPAGFLFLVRVRAVYNDLPRFKVFISAIWVAYTGCCLLIFIGIKGIQVAPLPRCIGILIKPYPAIMFFVMAGYDLFLCAAVTYKITYDLAMEKRELKLWWSIRHPNNPFIKLRARFLSDSHAFFLLTFLLKTTEIVVYFRGTTAVLLIFCLLDSALISLIACKIYRRFKLGRSGILHSSYEATTLQMFDAGGPESVVDIREMSEDEQVQRQHTTTA